MNVKDHLKPLTKDAIINTLQEHYVNAGVGMFNVNGNLNLGGIIRSANAFGFNEVIYYGRKRWDRRGAVGTYQYTPLRFVESEEAFLEQITQKYTLVAVENNVDFECVELFDFVWPENPFILMGEENSGLPTNVLEHAKHIITIPDCGSVRSFNVTSAASIAMYDYVSKRTRISK